MTGSDLTEPEGVNAGSAEPEPTSDRATSDRAVAGSGAGGPADPAQTAAPVDTDDSVTRAARASAPGQENEVGEG